MYSNNIVFYCKDQNFLEYAIKQSNRAYKIFNKETIKYNSSITDDIIFTDFKGLVTLKKFNIHINCYKFYIFDCLELTLHLKKMEAVFYNDQHSILELLSLHYFNKCNFLFPESNKFDFITQYPNLPYTIFYKKINYSLLKNMEFKSIDKSFYRQDRDQCNIQEFLYKKFPTHTLISLPKENEIELFDYKNLIYFKKQYALKYEQFGRIVFEYLLLNKNVYFYDNPFDYNDGLLSYLKYYNISIDPLSYKAIYSLDNLIKSHSNFNLNI